MPSRGPSSHTQRVSPDRASRIARRAGSASARYPAASSSDRSTIVDGSMLPVSARRPDRSRDPRPAPPGPLGASVARSPAPPPVPPPPPPPPPEKPPPLKPLEEPKPPLVEPLLGVAIEASTIEGAAAWKLRHALIPAIPVGPPGIGERRLSTGTRVFTCFSTSSATSRATAHARYCSQMTTASAGAFGRSEKSFRYVRNASRRFTRVRSSTPSFAWIRISAIMSETTETGTSHQPTLPPSPHTAVQIPYRAAPKQIAAARTDSRRASPFWIRRTMSPERPLTPVHHAE